MNQALIKTEEKKPILLKNIYSASFRREAWQG